MDETKFNKQLYSFLQLFIYISIILECFILVVPYLFNGTILIDLILKVNKLFIYQDLLRSKMFTFFIILLVAIGSKPRKSLTVSKKSIFIPLMFGFILFYGSFYFLSDHTLIFEKIYQGHLYYFILSLSGALCLAIGFDNISKMIKTNLGKDRFNTENESFEQPIKLIENEYSINIPTVFKYKGKLNKGFMNILNPFRGSVVIGTPGSGKSFSIIVPYIKQLLAKGFSGIIYDVKYPELGKMAYYHFNKNKKLGNFPKSMKFHVINLTNVEYSRRVNPLSPKYIKTQSVAAEDAEGLLLALLKTGTVGKGSEQFFNQSAINLLAAIIYFLSRFENGRYSTFAHVLEFVNQSYAEIFLTLKTNTELEALLQPFMDTIVNKSFEQLDAQMGTLRINVSRIANKETYWVFTGDDIELKISDPDNPSIVILANSIETNSSTSASNALILNRITKLINSKGNRPTLVAVDELPTIYFHKIDELIATARSNKVAVLLGLQDLSQLEGSYTKIASRIINSVIGNLFSGAVRDKETLSWLELLFGKIKQKKESISFTNKGGTTHSINESLDHLIPASKISSLGAGQIVAKVANETDINADYDPATYNCKMNLNVKAIKDEEAKYKELPKYYNFKGKKEEILLNNYNKVKKDIQYIIGECIPAKKID